MTFWVDLLHCRGGVLYVGHTDNLEARIGAHQSGRIKGWSRAKKLALIRGDWTAISTLAKGKGGPSTSSGRTGEAASSGQMEEGRAR